jgi:hypothetical protein
MPVSIQELRFRFEAPRLARTTSTKAGCSAPVGPALPRITPLMALAIKIGGLLEQYPDLDALELARRTHVSRSRITQILNLLCLAPDIQEQLLWLPPLAKGHEVISEKSLRRLAAEYDWVRQRERFTPLLARRSGICDSSRSSEHSNSIALQIQSSASAINKMEPLSMTSNLILPAMRGRHA